MSGFHDPEIYRTILETLKIGLCVVPFGIFCIRLDQIEQFRASYGQEASNSILRVTAQTIENSLRPTDLVGRWGKTGSSRF